MNSGTQRYTFEVAELSDGLSLVALAMGLFAVTDTLANVNPELAAGRRTVRRGGISAHSLRPDKGDLKKSLCAADPCAAPTIGSFFRHPARYRLDDRLVHVLRDREARVAHATEALRPGCDRGRNAGPEASNNAAAQTAFVPTMTLGIPGDPVMALVLGAMIIHGIQPGPQMLAEEPDIFWGLVATSGSAT